MKLDLVFCRKCQSSHGPRQPCQVGVEPTPSHRKDGDAGAEHKPVPTVVTKPLTTDVLAGAESTPKPLKKKKPRRGRFDKTEYQKNYMRDWYRPAKKLGLTVEEYKLKFLEDSAK